MSHESLQVVDLRVDFIDRPLGLENLHPRLSWRLESTARNVRQTAYRIWVASSEEELQAQRGDLWDSGKILSQRSFGIAYEGKELQSRQRCWWRIQIWDEADTASAPSAISTWEMGLLDPRDWIAQWLAVEDAVSRADRAVGLQWVWGGQSEDPVAQKFRLTFTLPEPAKAGEFFAVANDMYSLQVTGIWIDGESIRDSESLPGRWLALKEMAAGEHILAVEVQTGKPFWGERTDHGLTFFARFDLQSGRTLRLGSGPDAKTSITPDPNWYARNYDDRSWEAVKLVDGRGYQPWPARSAMQLRRTFSLQKEIVAARLYATALGAYEARINGRRVGDALLTPEASQYAKHVLYRVYDVTPMLAAGTNVLGLIVADGWYGSFDGHFAFGPAPLRALAQLELTFADGSRQTVATGPDWRIAESPIRRSEIGSGELYDARLEQPGWDTAEFDDSHWQASQVAETPDCRVAAQVSPPIRVMQTLEARSVTEIVPGTYLFDFGRNFSGWCRLHMQGASGSRVELRFAELRKPTGELETGNLAMGQPKKDAYILRGDASGETFEPHFTYRGFRYVQVSGLSTMPTLKSIEGIFIHSDLPVTGRFRAGAPLIEKIWQITLESQRSNFVGIPTDCPSREQRGWLGDALVFWDAAAFNMDVCTFTLREMDNIVDDQAENGSFRSVSPLPLHNDSVLAVPGSAPGWGDAGVILPWIAWRHYGDLSIIERYWDAMNRYVQFIFNYNPDYIWRNERAGDFGDWFAVDQRIMDPSIDPTTPRDLVATAFWAYSTSALAEMAEAVGRTSDAKRLHALFDRIREAFIQNFVQPDGRVGNESQTSYILALRLKLLPEELRAAAAKRLAEDVRRRGVALSTGILGTQFILEVLADAGFQDLSYGLLLREEFPSWGYMIRNGATTMWETWSGDLKVADGRQKMSQNHYMMGAICWFLFRRVAGIDATAAGFEAIAIRPIPDARVKSAGADYDSVMGRISTDWTISADGRFTLDVVIPANATARIHLPAQPSARIREGGSEIADFADMCLLHRSDGEAVVEVGSGKYQFSVEP